MPTPPTEDVQTAPPGVPCADLDAFLARIPDAHRGALRSAIEQWQCAMWLAARHVDGAAQPAAGADPFSAPLLRVYADLIETLAGEPLGAVHGTRGGVERVALARAFGELAGTLARLGGAAVAQMDGTIRSGATPDVAIRTLYDRYVEAWEAGYAEWMSSDSFARLQGELCNAALALRVAGSGEPGA